MKSANGGTVSISALTEAQKASTLAAKAQSTALKALSMAGNMLLMMGISEAVQLIYSCATASSRLQESARELGSQFSSTQSEIENYRVKIDGLYKTINDSSSSYETTSSARKELLSLQDEMIAKFGNEADAVRLVTEAVNGQTDALDTLTEQEWQENKNAFISGSENSWDQNIGNAWANFWSGSTDNFDRMKKEMEDTEITFFMPRLNMENSAIGGVYDKFTEEAEKIFGAETNNPWRLPRDLWDALGFNNEQHSFTLSGDLDEIYDKLLNLQSLARNMGVDEAALGDLSKQTGIVKKRLDDYHEFYDNSTLYDKINTNKDYRERLDNINNGYKRYQDAFAAGDAEAVSRAEQSYAEIVQKAAEGIDDQSVIDYFTHLYPELQDAVGSWEFEVRFKAALEDSSDMFENDVRNAADNFVTSGDILNFNAKNATEEQITDYARLNAVADDYGLTLEQLVDKMAEMGLITPQITQDLIIRLTPSIKNGQGTNSVFGSAFSDIINQVDADTVKGWTASLSEEDAMLANSVQFENALERQKEKLNGATLSADNYNAALEEVKTKQAETENHSTFSEAWSALDNTEDGSPSPLKNELLSLAEAGQLTVEAFNSIEGSEDFLSQLGLEPENATAIEEITGSINELVSSTDQLASMKKGISGLSQNLYARQQDPGTPISAETFQGMDAGLKAQTKEWDNYVSVLGNASSSMDDVQAATDKLAAAYINSNDFLANLTESNKDYYTSQLQAMGVANAEEIVQQKLTDKYLVHDLSMEALAMTKTGVNEVTMQQVNALLNEAGATDAVRYAIGECIAQEQIFANNDLGTYDKAEQLKTLIGQLYGAAAAAAFYNKVSVKNGGAQNSHETISLSEAKEQVEEEFAPPAITPPMISPSQSKGGGSRGGSSGGSSPAKTETPEIFDFIETALSRIKSKIEDVKNATKETFQSFKDRAKSYTDAISSIGREIDIQEQARQKYLNKANEVGLEGAYVWQIQNGSDIIDSVTDEGLKKRIRDYKEWYEKALACEKAVKDLKKEQKELAREQIELTVTKYDKRISRKDAAKDRAQAKIDYKEARGISVTAKDYTSIKDTSVSQIKNYQAMNARIRELRNSVAKGSEAWEEYQARIDANNKSVLELKTSLFETAKAAAALAGQKAEKRAAKKDTANEFLDAEIENTKAAKDKNVLIKSKIKNINKKKKDYQAAVDTDKKNVQTAGNQLKKFKKTPENKAILKKIKKHVKNKEKIPDSVLKDVSSLKNGGELLKRCAAYNAYMDALQADQETADLFAQTSKTEIANLELERFSNISQEWDNSLYSNTQKETSLNSQLERNEATGNKQDNLGVYRSLMANKENEQSKLINKRKALQKRLNLAVSSGRVKEGSSQWLQMVQEIDGVTNAIDNATQSLLDYQKSYNSLQWGLFDDAMEELKRLNTEADYYIDRMANEELVDKENGELTSYGAATLALHQKNYQSYLNQAEEYKKEYQKLMGQIQDKQLNAADPEVKARLQELQDGMRDANLMADKSLQMGKEILQNVYDKQLEKVSSLISKYKELMHTEKDAYEYQRTIEQKVKDLASLQKRLNAYAANDDTEENRARIQKIKMELADAKEDLKDTQYDKYLSDTETMLDEMYEDMESFFDEKLGNTDAILKEISKLIGTDSETIIATLKSVDGNLSTALEKSLEGGAEHSKNEDQKATDANTETKNTGAKDVITRINIPSADTSRRIPTKNTAKANAQKNLAKKLQRSSSRNTKKNILKSNSKNNNDKKNAGKNNSNTKDVIKRIPKMQVDNIRRIPIEPPEDTRTQDILRNIPLHTPAEEAKNILSYDPSVLLRDTPHNLILLPSNEILSASNLMKDTERMQNINISFGGITMNDVNDPQTFAKQLREEICKNGQTTKCITEAVISNAMGNGVGNAKFYQY